MSIMHTPNKDFYVVYKGGCISNNVYLQWNGIKIYPNNEFRGIYFPKNHCKAIIKIILYENSKSLIISLWPEL